jgi:hypothetical protein
VTRFAQEISRRSVSGVAKRLSSSTLSMLSLPSMSASATPGNSGSAIAAFAHRRAVHVETWICAATH